MSLEPNVVGPRVSLRRLALVVWLSVASAATACSPDPTEAGDLPEDILDPDVVESLSGAMAAYNGTLFQFGVAFGGFSAPWGGNNVSFIATTGLLADELQSGDIGAPVGTLDPTGVNALDSRNLPEYQNSAGEPLGPAGAAYGSLQRVRGQAREALGLLDNYAPDSTALTAHVYATIGYAGTFLAELFCSGIPLSTLEFDGTYTLRPGATTEAVYEHALVMFDSALALAGSRDRIVNLARIGKARALLGLGRAAEAGQAAGGVPDGFRYALTYSTAAIVNRNVGFVFPPGWFATVADQEGGTGLDYVASGDPRTGSTPTGGTNGYGVTLRHPSKYSSAGTTPIVLADWVEARLIEAEAALQAQQYDTWLAKLNQLRQQAPMVNPAWPVLPDTTDPGVDSAGSDAPRVDLLFRERGFWLFLTGHRLGDMRRLVRQYGRAPEAVFPTGSYPGASGTYGEAVTAPIPAAERAFNPHFTGCLSRGA